MRNNINMMRRTFVAASVLALVGCGSVGNGSSEAEEPKKAASSSDATPSSATGSETQTSAEAAPAGSGKVLVVYYSRADENYANGGTEWLEVGHTKVMAGYIAEALGADTYEIVPVKPYPEGYDDCCDVAMEEQKSDARPKIAGELPDVSAYDTVFVGCPIWWGDEPMIVRTFIDGVDLSGKTIVPFTTHGGSGLGNVPTNLLAAIPGANFLDGHAVAGTAVDEAHDEVVDWAKSLVLSK